MIFGHHLNVNSLRYKFEALKLITENIVIFSVSETKLNESFPVGQFCIDGYSEPFRLDKNDKSGGILVYIRSDIVCREIISDLPENFEGLFIEL